MSKKMMLRALAVLGAVFLALPAMVSAQEIHLEPAESFTLASSGWETRTQAEPNPWCTGSAATGKFDTGSTTTGTVSFGFSNCHTFIFGITTPCKSEGAAAGTIVSGGTFHLITISTGVPGFLLTTDPTVLVCGGISTSTRTGSLIGTITAPKCGESSKTLSLSFTATESTQNHPTYTGTNYDLVSKTAEGENKTIAWVTNTSLTRANAGKLNCT
jgi:hypothetical protein